MSMKYGQFIFKCNCGNEIEFSPQKEMLGHFQPSDTNYNALKRGIEKAGINYTYDTGLDEYMCADCLALVKHTQDVVKIDMIKALSNVLKERCKLEV